MKLFNLGPKLNKEVGRLLRTRLSRDKSYYFLSLFADADGKFSYQMMSKWAGFTDETPKREIRDASLVNGVTVRSFFKSKGEPVFVVNTKNDLQFFMLLVGGHGLIESQLAKQFINHLLQPQVVSFIFDDGWVNIDSIPKKEFNRAPNPTLRMKILNRDKRRCMICGASPANNEHVELHLHHIIPFGMGGITDENNLITLCHTCHKGLLPEVDYSLFDTIGVQMFSKRLSSDQGVQYVNRIHWNVHVNLTRSKKERVRKK